MAKRRKLRGFTLFETAVSAAMTVMVTFAGLSLFITGSSTWGRGEQAIAVEDSSRVGLRKAVDELREAMQVTVDSDGMGLTFQKPLKDSNGDYVLPVQSDGLNRRLYYSNGNMYMNDGKDPVWIVARNVITTDPFMLNISALNSGILTSDSASSSSNSIGNSNTSGTASGSSSGTNSGGLGVSAGVGGTGVSLGNTSGGTGVGVGVGGVSLGVSLGSSAGGSSSAVAPVGSSSTDPTLTVNGSATTAAIAAAPAYSIFVPDGNAVTRSVIIKLVTENTGGLRTGVISRHREQIFFRNVATATR